MKRDSKLWALLLASAVACSSGTPDGGNPAGSGTVMGNGTLAHWSHVASSHWIAKPDLGSPPLILYLFESQVGCSAMARVGWDAALKGAILEIDLWEVGDAGPMLAGSQGPLLGDQPISTPRTFTIGMSGATADASYLLGN